MVIILSTLAHAGSRTKPKTRKEPTNMAKLTSLLLCFAVICTFFVACGVKPTLANAPLSLGEKYLLDLDYDQAIAQLEEAIKIEPKNPRIQLLILYVYVHEDYPQEEIDGRLPKDYPFTPPAGDPNETPNAKKISWLLAIIEALQKLNIRDLALELLKRLAEEFPLEQRVGIALHTLADELGVQVATSITTAAPLLDNVGFTDSEMQKYLAYADNYAKSNGYETITEEQAMRLGELVNDVYFVTKCEVQQSTKRDNGYWFSPTARTALPEYAVQDAIVKGLKGAVGSVPAGSTPVVSAFKNYDEDAGGNIICIVGFVQGKTIADNPSKQVDLGQYLDAQQGFTIGASELHRILEYNPDESHITNELDVWAEEEHVKQVFWTCNNIAIHGIKMGSSRAAVEAAMQSKGYEGYQYEDQDRTDYEYGGGKVWFYYENDKVISLAFYRYN